MYSTWRPEGQVSNLATANVAMEANKIRVDFMIDFGRNGDVMLKWSRWNEDTELWENFS